MLMPRGATPNLVHPGFPTTFLGSRSFREVFIGPAYLYWGVTRKESVLSMFTQGNSRSGRQSSKARQVHRTLQSPGGVRAVSLQPGTPRSMQEEALLCRLFIVDMGIFLGVSQLAWCARVCQEEHSLMLTVISPDPGMGRGNRGGGCSGSRQ